MYKRQVVETIVADVATVSAGDWSDTEKSQIRHQLSIDGTKTPPTVPGGSAIVIAPGSGNITTAYLTCLSDALAVQAGVTVSQEFLEPGDSGFAYDGSDPLTFNSGSNGVVQMPAAKGATYRFWRGTNKSGGIVVTIPLDADSTFLLPSLVGR